LVATLWLASADFTPWVVVERDRTLVILMFVALVFGAAVEELGWTGYATPISPWCSRSPGGGALLAIGASGGMMMVTLLALL
jgi:hypothetical protein